MNSVIQVRNHTATSILGSEAQGIALGKEIQDALNVNSEAIVSFNRITGLAIAPIVAAFRPVISELGADAIGSFVKLEDISPNMEADILDTLKRWKDS